MSTKNTSFAVALLLTDWRDNNILSNSYHRVVTLQCYLIQPQGILQRKKVLQTTQVYEASR